MLLNDAASLAVAAINLKSDEKGVKHIKMSRIRSDTKLLESVSSGELEKYAVVAQSKFPK